MTKSQVVLLIMSLWELYWVEKCDACKMRSVKYQVSTKVNRVHHMELKWKCVEHIEYVGVALPMLFLWLKKVRIPVLMFLAELHLKFIFIISKDILTIFRKVPFYIF